MASHGLLWLGSAGGTAALPEFVQEMAGAVTGILTPLVAKCDGGTKSLWIFP